MFIREWVSPSERAIVLICHGIGEHCGRYDVFAKFLTRAGFTVYSRDLPGHGMAEGQRGYVDSFEDLTGAMVELTGLVRQEKRETPLFLFGHSMGGLISARLVEEYPEIFEAVVLSAPHLFSAKESVKKLLPVIKVLKSIAPKVTFSSSSRFTPADLSNNERAVQRYIDDPYVHDRVSPALFLGMEDNIELAFERVARIEIPTMIVYGSQDSVVDPAGAKKFYEQLTAKKKLVEIPGGKHEMFDDDQRRETFFEEVASFFLQFL